jgi:hypothetical protein
VTCDEWLLLRWRLHGCVEEGVGDDGVVDGRGSRTMFERCLDELRLPQLECHDMGQVSCGTRRPLVVADVELLVGGRHSHAVATLKAHPLLALLPIRTSVVWFGSCQRRWRSEVPSLTPVDLAGRRQNEVHSVTRSTSAVPIGPRT